MGSVLGGVKECGKTIEDALFVNYCCIVCGDEIDSNCDSRICDECKKTFPILPLTDMCSKCGAPLNKTTKICDDCKLIKFNFDEARASFEYSGKAKNLILALKYKNKKYLAKEFARLMYECYLKWGVVVDMLVPVPISDKRRKFRGYNQSEIIAEEFAKLTGISTFTNIVARIDNDTTQQHSTRKERFENMKGVFKLLDKSPLTDKNILIIDDVYTTGATANELSTMLKKLKPRKIYVLTAGKTLFNNNNTTKRKWYQKLFMAG